MYTAEHIKNLAICMVDSQSSPNFISIVDNYTYQGMTAKEILTGYMTAFNNHNATRQEINDHQAIIRICSGLGKYPAFLSPESESPIHNNNSSAT